MNILFDIGHPGHVHYFKYLIKKLKHNGNTVKVVARDRGIIFDLLDHYEIEYTSRGMGGKSLLGKLFYTIKADLFFYKYFREENIEVSVSFCTGYPAHISWLTNKYSISLNDTEHTNATHKKFVYPFSDVVVTPDVFYEDIGSKQIKINCFMESLYLDKTYFEPNNIIYEYLNIEPTDKFILFRFIKWDAHHDVKVDGLSDEFKETLVNIFISRGYKVFISSEEDILPNSLKKYLLQTPVHLIHSVLAKADLFISESGTMASEAAYLGTHVIYTNPLPLMGYLKESKEYDLLFHLLKKNDIKQKIYELVNSENLKQSGMNKSSKMKSKHVDANHLLYKIIVDGYKQIKEKNI